MAGVSVPLVLRYIYRGETLRNGRVLPIDTAAGTEVSGNILLEALASPEANVPLRRVVPFYYAKELEGWRRLHRESTVRIGDERRIEVMLEPPASPSAPAGGDEDDEGRRLALRAAAVAGDAAALDPERMAALCASDGYFGVGVYNSKTAENVGTLWRSAFMLGAQFLFTIGGRNAWEKTADTCKAWRSVPAFRYDDFASFCAITYPHLRKSFN